MSKEMEKAFDEAYPKGKKEKEPYISHDTLQQTVKDLRAEQKELLMDYGLLKIRNEQLQAQLKSCETALERRDAAFMEQKGDET